jgi:hypothetical protein
MLRRIALGMLTVLLLGVAPAGGAIVTNAADAGRTGWYPGGSALTPELVAGSSFGQMFKTTLASGDQIDAQPLVVGDTVIVVTEQNRAYGIDAGSGAVRWQRGPTKAGGALDLGNPMRTAEETRDPASPGDAGCDVPRRTTGITSTPVADTATNAVYFLAKHYVTANDGALAYTLHAVDIDTGVERPGFPKDVPEGLRSDNHGASGPDFTAQWELQRPGLLLLGGVVYSAYAGHCDRGHYEGWVIGQSAATGAVTGAWAAVPSTPGAGIWQSGGGLVSDGPGRVLLTTGNGRSPSGAGPITSPPAGLGSSVVRISVGPDRRLSTADFFAPYDAALLDRNDVDFGSGGPVALPDAYFGTPTFPHLMVAMGKQGVAYLLNRDHLGGYRAGIGGGDDVLQAGGTIGGVWSRPSVWPGDGGWLWVNTASGSGGECCGGNGKLEALGYGVNGNGEPRFTVGQSESLDAFSLDGGAPVITSDGATDGTGIVWIVRAPYNGYGGELRAYRAVPDPATSRPVLIKAWPIGRAGKFQPPGVGAGRIYVAARGCLSSVEPGNCSADTPAALLSFGSPTVEPLTGASLSFPDTQVGGSTSLTATLTATRDVKVTQVSASNAAAFGVGSPSPALGTTLHAGDQITVPVTFHPTAINTITATLSLATLVGGTAGSVEVGLSGQAVTPDPQLRTLAPISFGGVVLGEQRQLSVPLTNDGGAPLSITAISNPGAGFSLPGKPGLPFTIPSGAKRILDILFRPTVVGAAESSIHVASDGGDIDIVLSAIAATPPHVEVAPLALDFGRVVVGETATRSFTVSNTGGSPATVSRSSPPGGGVFTPLTSLTEGTTLAANEVRTLTVRFSPTAVGTATNGWSINAADGQGQRNLAFTGEGVPPPAPDVAPAGPGIAGTGLGVLVDRIAPRVTLGRLSGRILRMRLGEDGRVRVLIERHAAGRRVSGRCAAPTRANRHRAACSRYVKVRLISRRQTAGTVKVTLPELPAGSYRLTITARDATGNTSSAHRRSYVKRGGATGSANEQRPRRPRAPVLLASARREERPRCYQR